VEQGMTKKDAIKAAARDRGVPKNEVYQQVLD
jgi:16S rRNA C1402 (ribose-2'-O) methylase RsmI